MTHHDNDMACAPIVTLNLHIPHEVSPLTCSAIDRIGRTGRVGNTGSATSFYDRGKDGGLARPLLDILAEAQQVFMIFFSSIT